MSRLSLLVLAALVLPVPALAAPPAKKPPCQQAKNPRDAKKVETCRESTTIPPVVDPTPFFTLAALTVSG